MLALKPLLWQCQKPGIAQAVGKNVRQMQKLSRNVSKPGKGKTATPTRRRAANTGMSLGQRQKMSDRPQRRVVKATKLDMGDFDRLQRLEQEDRSTHKSLLDKIKAFEDLRINQKLRDQMIKAISADHPIKSPTHIQTLAIKLLRSTRRATQGEKTWLFAAETGSGKTLAYLLPTLSDAMDKHASFAQDRTQDHGLRRPPGIGAIVLVPTLELVTQVHEVAQKISPPEIVPVVLGADAETSETNRSVHQGVDLLITTPMKLLKTVEQNKKLYNSALKHVQTVVIDEADSLLNISFINTTERVLALCKAARDTILVTATIPRSFEKTLREKFPRINRLVTPSLHRVPRHIDFKVIEAFRPPYSNKKDLALKQVIYSIFKDNSEPGVVKRIVVFVNRNETVPEVVKILQDAKYDAEGIFGSSKPDERKQVLEAFMKPADPLKGETKKAKILVATDLVARGVDMNKVKNVVLYDLPWSAADLLHRAGRTGRLNSKGRVVLIITSKEHHGWIKGLERVIKKGEALA